MNLEIVTPDKKLFSGEVDIVTVPGNDGSLGILDNHAPLITTLKKGSIRITDKDKKVTEFPVNGGVVEVLKNKVIILAD
jgi:F-type H+-transporting ATPase subunit epsilon